VTVDTDRATRLRVRPLTGRIGAELSGVHLANLDDDDVAGIRQALLAHRVVFLRDQSIGAAEQIAFASRLGPLTLSHPTLPRLTEDPEIFDLDSIAGATANHWHTDVTFVDRPPIFSVLRALVIPEVGGDTLWANTVAGYRDLPDDLRQLADGLRAVHSNGHDYGRFDVAGLKGTSRPEQIAHLQAFVSEVFETEHPVVRIHPETGEPALLLGGFAHQLVGHATASPSI
jgi:taurine dioxygenase